MMRCKRGWTHGTMEWPLNRRVQHNAMYHLMFTMWETDSTVGCRNTIKVLCKSSAQCVKYIHIFWACIICLRIGYTPVMYYLFCCYLLYPIHLTLLPIVQENTARTILTHGIRRKPSADKWVTCCMSPLHCITFIWQTVSSKAIYNNRM